MAVLVLGGSRGVGAEISRALKAAEFSVAATCERTDVEVLTFSKKEKIDVYEWSIDTPKSMIMDIGAKTGIIRAVVASIDIPDQKMSPEQWSKVVEANIDMMQSILCPVFSSEHTHGFRRAVLIVPICDHECHSELANQAVERVVKFVRVLAKKCQEPLVAVNAICLGHFDTDIVMHSLSSWDDRLISTSRSRFLEDPIFIASLAARLVSSDMDYINGRIIAPGYSRSYIARNVFKQAGEGSDDVGT